MSTLKLAYTPQPQELWKENSHISLMDRGQEVRAAGSPSTILIRSRVKRRRPQIISTNPALVSTHSGLSQRP